MVQSVESSFMKRSGTETRTVFPKWEWLKNKSGKSGMFFEPEKDRQLTSFHQQSTTNSPSKNHVLHTVFAKTPSKNAGYPAREKILQKRPLSGLVLASSGGDGDGGGSLRGGEAQGVVILFQFEAEGFDDEVVVVALRQAGDGD